MSVLASELVAVVGKRGFLNLDGLHIRVSVRDARRVWGRFDLLVAPVDLESSGEKWVELSRVDLDTPIEFEYAD